MGEATALADEYGEIPDQPGDLRPLSARSAVLTLLLCAHPPTLSAAEIVRTATHAGVSGGAVRAALSRLVAAGDLVRTDSVYTLSERLLERQRRSDAVMAPVTVPWRDDWEMVVVTASGRSAADRAALRSQLAGFRLAELREGVWTRPANLPRDLVSELSGVLSGVAEVMSTRPADPVALARRLWDLDGWAAAGHALLGQIRASQDDPVRRLPAVVAGVRHVLTDPVLPPRLLPPDWPGDGLRTAYSALQSDLRAVRAW